VLLVIKHAKFDRHSIIREQWYLYHIIKKNSTYT
jgi:hypothetical protein